MILGRLSKPGNRASACILQKRGSIRVEHPVRWVIFVLAALLISRTAEAIEIGEIPPRVELKEKLGGAAGWKTLEQ